MPAQGPSRKKFLCFSEYAADKKQRSHFGLVMGKNKAHLLFLPGFLFTGAAKVINLGSEQAETEQTVGPLTNNFIGYVHY